MEIIVAVVTGILVGSVVGGAACWWVQGSRAKSRQSVIEAHHREEKAALQGRLEERDNAKEILEMAKEQLRESFQATASQALQANNSQFMDLAQENLGKTLEAAKGDFKQRHEQFECSGAKAWPERWSSPLRRTTRSSIETGKLSSPAR